jgi:hypothetical protein
LNRTDNTMATRQRTQTQIMIYKTLHRKLKVEQHEPYKRMGENTGAQEQTIQ